MAGLSLPELFLCLGLKVPELPRRALSWLRADQA
jgi:hypothetical protein